jgi:glycosidase
MNLFDSHDTDRLASMFVNPDLPYDAANRIQDNGPQYSPAKPGDLQWTRMKQEVVFQMTFLGAPMIYYGDEAGMWGPDDPSNRMPMLWKDLAPYDDPRVTFKQDLFDHYQRLIALRKELKPLRRGYFTPVKAVDRAGVLVFNRTLGADTVTVALNRSPEKHTITLPSEFPVIDRLNSTTISPAGGTISVTLDPYGSAILTPEK